MTDDERNYSRYNNILEELKKQTAILNELKELYVAMSRHEIKGSEDTYKEKEIKTE